MSVPEDPEVAALLDTIGELLEGMRRLSDLADRLIVRATDRLTTQEAQDARRELDTTRAAIEKLDAMLLLRRQGCDRCRPCPLDGASKPSDGLSEHCLRVFV